MPHSFTVVPGGRGVLFLRSAAGDDPTGLLWRCAPDGTERLLADPRALAGAGGAEPPQERDRRERARVPGEGFVGYSTDLAARRVVLGLGGGLWLVDGADGEVPATPRPVPVEGPALAPLLSPDGARLAYVTGGALHVVGVDDGLDVTLAAPEGPDVAYGLCDHVSAEEIGRERGMWWSPGSDALLVARVDVSGVAVRWIADPAHPERPPRRTRYAAAGTANAVTTLHVLRLDGGRVDVDLPARAAAGHPAGGPWTDRAFEYVTSGGWDAHGPLVGVQTRDQRTVLTLAVDPADGTVRELAAEHDEQWVALLPGAPLRTASGALVSSRLLPDGTRGLALGPDTTPPGLQVRALLGVDGERVLLSAGTDPAEVHVWECRPGDPPRRLSSGPGLHRGVRAADTLVLDGTTPQGTYARVVGPGAPGVLIASHAEQPVVDPRPRMLTLGPRALRSALFLPSWHTGGTGRLPVLLCPYGGYGLGLVVRARGWWTLVAQWFAEQGFAVLITDGRGTPGRGADWEKSIFGDRLTPVLEDQVDAVREAARRYPELDLGRVGVRGWSYGGYLAAAAVLYRPDVFHAAVAGAAPTDRRLYDTHWEERFLGHPDVQPENYRRSSLLQDAARLSRPLLLVHGLADDNVSVAHMLRFSAALLAAGRPHQVLPLSGVSHTTTRGGVGGALLLHELAFLRSSVGCEGAVGAGAARRAGVHSSGTGGRPVAGPSVEGNPS
ncbi:prolyl oligopeptidase family serine peptidase [Streptomyces sp. NPDC049954]|uniref:S9 family peptidase n=1 Tax=Streptomyces sp. NPDC049954 TaxID=3155779 RepID=UPI00343F7469